MPAVFYTVTKDGIRIDPNGPYVVFVRGSTEDILVDFRSFKVDVYPGQIVRYRVYYIGDYILPLFNTDDWAVHVNQFIRRMLFIRHDVLREYAMHYRGFSVLVETFKRDVPHIVDNRGRKMRVVKRGEGIDVSGRDIAVALGEFWDMYIPEWVAVV